MKSGLKKELDIRVLASGYWCPAMESWFPQLCDHMSPKPHADSECVEALVVTKK